ncbi:MAG: hypothetical protein ACR2OZ_21175 [Verrucomicrobiales bacterium]
MKRFGWIILLTAISPGAESICPPPAELAADWNLSSFYKKHLTAGGIPILASDKVSDFALKEARFLIDQMLEGRDDVRQAIVKNKVRLAIMAPNELTTCIPEHSDLTPAKYWDKRARGLGATKIRPAVSCGEENLLSYRGDPYAAENILIHEFAHVIHQMGLDAIDSTFDERLKETYRAAIKAGLWKGTYAASNRHEYWAEGVQSWFDTNRENDNQHNHVDTREELEQYDAALSALIAKELGDRPWRYQRPASRPADGRKHLEGYDAAMAPVFAWPKELVDWNDSYVKRLAAKKPDSVPLEMMPAPSDPAKSPPSADDTAIVFVNRRSRAVTLYWVDFDGRKKSYGTLPPGAERRQSTFAGHRWIISNENDEALAAVVAQSVEGQAVIK